jgi:PIN domain nuclease of toxin-antitoxin system
LGKLDADPAALAGELESGGFVELPVTARHAAAVTRLPPLHRDPFDRLLIAQALCESMILLTSDRALTGYGAAVQSV